MLWKEYFFLFGINLFFYVKIFFHPESCNWITLENSINLLAFFSHMFAKSNIKSSHESPSQKITIVSGLFFYMRILKWKPLMLKPEWLQTLVSILARCSWEEALFTEIPYLNVQFSIWNAGLLKIGQFGLGSDFERLCSFFFYLKVTPNILKI